MAHDAVPPPDTPSQPDEELYTRGTGALVRQVLLLHWLEITATLILTVGSLVAAWSGSQAARWGGLQSSSYTAASARRVDAVRAANRAGQLSLYDSMTFDGWVRATGLGLTMEADLYRRRFRQEFVPSFEAWLARDPFNNPEAPPSPLFMPEYVPQSEVESQQLEQEAERLFTQGERANTISSNYALNGFFAAVALFFAGTAPRFKWRPLRTMMVLVGSGMLLWCILNGITYPKM